MRQREGDGDPVGQRPIDLVDTGQSVIRQQHQPDARTIHDLAQHVHRGGVSVVCRAPSPAQNWLRGQDRLQLPGPALRYELTLEPLRIPVLPLLEMSPGAVGSPLSLPDLTLTRSPELQWSAPRPITERLRLTAEAHPRWQAGMERRGVQLAGEMPSLPSQNSSLRTALMADLDYMTLLLGVSERLSGWILQAQAAGQLGATVPPEVVLYTLFARACDPVLAVLKAGGHPDERIINWVMATTFDGLRAR